MNKRQSKWTTQRLSDIYRQMKQRCYNPNNPNYKNYGGRGIVVCDDWLKPINFIEWAKTSGYDDTLTIDRINVNGNYEPTNCRWVTKSEQAYNRTNSHYIEIDGELLTDSQVAKKYNISESKLRMYRLHDFEKFDNDIINVINFMIANKHRLKNNLNATKYDEFSNEFYTKYEDIARELDNYDLSGLRIICPCDGENSAFVKYMKDKGYNFQHCEGSYESVDYNEYDCVITNPPFKNYQRFYNLIKDKLFIVVAPLTVSYKSWFNYQEHTVGYSGRIKEFYRPDGSIEKLGNVVWITNMKQQEGKPLPLCDNMEGMRVLDDCSMEIAKKKDIPNIPNKYYVPITIFEHTPLPSNIKILGVNNNCRYQGKKLYTRFLVEVK